MTACLYAFFDETQRMKCSERTYVEGSEWGFGYCAKCVDDLRKAVRSGQIIQYKNATGCNWWHHQRVAKGVVSGFVKIGSNNHMWIYGSMLDPDCCKLSNSSRKAVLQKIYLLYSGFHQDWDTLKPTVIGRAAYHP